MLVIPNILFQEFMYCVCLPRLQLLPTQPKLHTAQVWTALPEPNVHHITKLPSSSSAVPSSIRHNKDHFIFNSSVIFIFYFIWKKESTLVFLSLRFNAFMQFLKRWIINYLKNYVFTFSKICIKIQKHFWQTHWQCDATGRPSETLAMICTLDTLQRRYHRTTLRWADRL